MVGVVWGADWCQSPQASWYRSRPLCVEVDFVDDMADPVGVNPPQRDAGG